MYFLYYYYDVDIVALTETSLSDNEHNGNKVIVNITPDGQSFRYKA